ncbi:hypothetical protein H4S06_003046, partial [Coemansia sp. BCRC 34490]
MPFPVSRLAFDLDSSTAVPSTPIERADTAAAASAAAVATPVEGGSSVDTHFNASLDKALQLLRHQTMAEGISRPTDDEAGPASTTTPMSWSSSTATLGAKSSYQDTASHTPDKMSKEETAAQEKDGSPSSLQETVANCQVRARIP